MEAMKQKCSKCGEKEKRAVNQKYCKDCHARYQREWRPKYSGLSDVAKKKNICRSYANVYEHRGKLKRRSSCERCNLRRVLEKHHEDYEKPLDVQWLCKECHLKLRKPLCQNNKDEDILTVREG